MRTRWYLLTGYKKASATITGDPLHSRAACTQPCNVNTHSRAHCSPGARLCEQWGHGCVNNGGTAVWTMGHGCVQVPGCVEGHPWLLESWNLCDIIYILSHLIVLYLTGRWIGLNVLPKIFLITVRLENNSRWSTWWLQMSWCLTWWRHQMETFLRYWPCVRGIHRWPVNSPHKGQGRGALMFSLICAWINGWVNNREAGHLRPYRAHYDVTVIIAANLTGSPGHTAW